MPLAFVVLLLSKFIAWFAYPFSRDQVCHHQVLSNLTRSFKSPYFSQFSFSRRMKTRSLGHPCYPYRRRRPFDSSDQCNSGEHSTRPRPSYYQSRVRCPSQSSWLLESRSPCGLRSGPESFTYACYSTHFQCQDGSFCGQSIYLACALFQTVICLRRQL